ncbi:MAG: DNA polymerase II large subunit [archaeon]
MPELIATSDVKKYYEDLVISIDTLIAVAKKARASGKDICNDVETYPAASIAEKTEVLTGPKGVAEVYHQLWDKYKKRKKVMTDIFDMIIDRQLGDIEDPQKRLDQAIRTALIIVTEGVVVSPLDGLPEIKININPDGTKYPDVYYAGPISAAGRSAKTLPLILADRARSKLHLDRYKPSKKEVDRYVEEILLMQESSGLGAQAKITEEEIRIIIENCPICINGVPDNVSEVSVNRDLERIKTNRLRGSMYKVVVEGILINAKKNLDDAKDFGLNWSWLEKLIKVKKTSEGTFELKPSTKYLEGTAAGRPILSYPLEPGGFRLRYGKGRNTCLMAKAINPASMYVLDEFIAVGTHGKVERPGKATQFFPCDCIDGPIVKLINGDVLRLDTVKDAKEVLSLIKEIIFLGDILITVGDFRKSGHQLIKSGFVEEEWLSEIKYLFREKLIEKIIYDQCLDFYDNPNAYTAVALSINNSKIPLFPKYIHYYDLLNLEQLKILISKSRNAEKIFNDKQLIIAAKLENEKEIKEVLEKIGLPHKINEDNKIEINEVYAYAFLKTTGALNAQDPIIEFNNLENLISQKTITEKLSVISKLDIREKSGTYIGARMGRPEAAHERIMAGRPNVLFPIGSGFGNIRDIIKASRTRSRNPNNTECGVSEVDIKSYICKNCKKITYKPYCEDCKTEGIELRECLKCKRFTSKLNCEVCNSETKLKLSSKFNIDNLIDRACKNLGVAPPEKMGGVKGLISKDKNAEVLEKGILRSKHGIYVFRDGTCRYEALNAVITHFNAKEINLSIEKLKELGYKKDYLGKDLKNEDQIVTLFPQDTIVYEGCGEYLLKVSKFVDDLLEKFYGQEKFYNAKTKEDLIGKLVLALAPHTSAAIVGRIIGYSKTKLGWGHPFFITAKRRNVDGDQDSYILMLDALLNFSQKYLSSKLGGKMDTPLVYTTVMNPYEVDDESHEIEIVDNYTYEFYQETKKFGNPKCEFVPVVSSILGQENQYDAIKFTHGTSCFDEGPKQSSYLTIKSMEDKINKQAKLQGRIRAVNLKDSLERLLHYHLFPDIIGNTRAFARQGLRCVKCNKKYRRIPLSGICTCGGKLILTIAEGSVKKYVEIAKNVIINYDLKPYLLQKIKLSEEEINSIFAKVEDKSQRSLSDFF